MQLNLTGAGVLTGEESGDGGVAVEPCGARVCPDSAADIDRVDRSRRMVWGSGTTGREGRVGTVVLGQCDW